MILSWKMKICAIAVIALVTLVNAGISKGYTSSKFRLMDPNLIPDILTMISTHVRNNYEQIETWQGGNVFTIDRIYEGTAAEHKFNTCTDGAGEIHEVIKKRIEGWSQFAIDLEKDLLYKKVVRENPPHYIDLETGRNLGTKSVPSQRITIVAPEYYIDQGPFTTRKGFITNRKAVKEARQKGLMCGKSSIPVSDPREAFVVGGAPIWETLPKYVDYIDQHGKFNVAGYPFKIKEYADGDLTEYHVQIPTRISSEYYRFITMVFSSRKGFNIVLYKETDSKDQLLRKKTWDYDLIGEVYVPSRTNEQIFEREDGKLNYEEEYKYKNEKINKPIPAETFTINNLGLKDGDEFIDKTTGEEFKYQDGKLIELRQESTPAADANDPNQSS